MSRERFVETVTAFESSDDGILQPLEDFHLTLSTLNIRMSRLRTVLRMTVWLRG
jgi:hypothetical protein